MLRYPSLLLTTAADQLVDRLLLGGFIVFCWAPQLLWGLVLLLALRRSLRRGEALGAQLRPYLGLLVPPLTGLWLGGLRFDALGELFGFRGWFFWWPTLLALAAMLSLHTWPKRHRAPE